MDEKIAELCGLHAGDGTLYKTNAGSVWELRGGEDEKTFYDLYIKKLLEQISDVNFWFGYRSGGTYGVRSCNMKFIQILLDAGFSVGSKTYTVRVPKWIREGKQEWKAAFLRGLYATDGCVTLAKINGSTVATYPRVTIRCVSKHLMNDVNYLLTELKITPNVSQSKHGHIRLTLNGVSKVQKFHECINIIQPKHIRAVRRYI
jgi:intein/homing endonuclease